MATFGERLGEVLKEANILPAELARRTKLSKQAISRLLNNTPHNITGSLPRPKIDTVEKIAKAINWDLDEARDAAGYAPIRTRPRVTNAAEFYAEIERMGLRTFHFSLKEREALDTFSPEDFDELLDGIESDVRNKIKRKMK